MLLEASNLRLVSKDENEKCHKDTKTLRFHKDYNISTTSLVKPLSLCVFPDKSGQAVAEKGFLEWTQLNNPLFSTDSNQSPAVSCQKPATGSQPQVARMLNLTSKTTFKA